MHILQTMLHPLPARDCVTLVITSVCHNDDRQPSQTGRSICLAGSWSHFRQHARSSHALTQTDREHTHTVVRGKKGQIRNRSILTTKLLLTFSKMRFSFSAIASPFRFLTRFFSSFLQAYILPVARTWQAQTWKTSNGETR